MAAPDSVLTAAGPYVRTEGGQTGLEDSERIAVVASFGTGPTVSRSLESMVVRLEECGYTVVVSRASDDDRPLKWSEAYAGHAVVLRKPNIGYDFGSWAVALDRFPAIRRAQYVLLVNDSLVGPFESLQAMVDNFENTPADVWAATNTTQFFPHIQSFFMGFRRGVLDERSLRGFWFNLPVETEKRRIIQEYELGLSRLLFSEAFGVTACFQSERVVDVGLNPSVTGWRRLLDLGFPFVKRELLTNPALVRADESVVGEIQARYGVDPQLWV